MNISKRIKQKLKKLSQQYAVVITRKDINKFKDKDKNPKGTTATYSRKTLHR